MSQFLWDNPAFWRYVPSALENISVHCSLVDCRVFRAASQSMAAGEKMINYCNTIKKITHFHHSPPHQGCELILQEDLSWKVNLQVSIWELEALSALALWRCRHGRKECVEWFLDWPLEQLALPFAWPSNFVLLVENGSWSLSTYCLLDLICVA